MGIPDHLTTERLHFHFSLSCIGEGNGNTLQCSCLEKPRDGGACWAAVYGVTQSRTRLKRLLLLLLFAGQEATGRTAHGTTDWFQIGKGVCQGCMLSPCLFNLYAKYIMRNAGLDEAQAGIKIAGRNINNLRYADESEVAQLCPTLCDPMDHKTTRILCPWHFPSKSTGVGCHFLLQGISWTQGSNLGLPHRRQMLYCLSHQGSQICT